MVRVLALLLACSPDEDSGPGKPDPLRDPDGDGFTDDDCAARDGAVHPGATEVCDGVDNNCDGHVDEGVTAEWFEDLDGDGAGRRSSGPAGCSPGEGWTTVGGDCDETNPAINPDATEICDERDNNCDGVTDEDLLTPWYRDADNDTFGDPATVCTMQASRGRGRGWDGLRRPRGDRVPRCRGSLR